MARLQATAALLCSVAALPPLLRTQLGPPPPPIEPYPPLNGGGFTGPAVPASPDPLVAYRWGSAVNTTQLQVYTLLPLSVTPCGGNGLANASSLTSANAYVPVTGPGCVLVDTGVESAAWVEFDFIVPSDARALQDGAAPVLPGCVTLGLSEYNQIGVYGKAAKAGTPVCYNNTCRLETNPQLYEGVRFMWLNVTCVNAPFVITQLRAVAQIRPTNYTGAFSASLTLTRAWYTAAYTVKVNLLESYIGAILIDRGDRVSWTGDAHVAQAAILAAFGDAEFVKLNIMNTATNANSIESYALYWILSVVDYWSSTGDTDTAQALADNIIGKLNHSVAVMKQGLPLTFFGWDDRLGSGFQDASSYEPAHDYQMLALRVWQDVGPMLTAAGRSGDATYWAAQAQAFITGLAQQYGASWWATLGFGIHAAADVINAHAMNASQADAAMVQWFNDSTTVCSLSNFNQYWIQQAFSNAGWLDEGMAAAELCWGAELDQGATTFWEISSPEWSLFVSPNDAVPNGENGYTSLCHPWSAGVTPWLTRTVGGLAPVVPGFRVVRIAPHLPVGSSDLAVTMPTPHGPVSVAAYATDSACVVAVDVPAGVSEAHLWVSEVLLQRLGCASSTPVVAAVGGEFVPLHMVDTSDEPSFRRLVAHGRTARQALLRLMPGSTRLEVRRTTQSAPAALPAPRRAMDYPSSFLGRDITTQGSWQPTYGEDGYILFSFNGSGQDAASLPSYVTSVAPTYHAFITDQWNGSTADVRALTVPGSSSAPRRIGCYATGMGGDPTFPVDVQLSVRDMPRLFQLAVYVVDWDMRGRRQSLDVLDACTFSRLAPWQSTGVGVGEEGADGDFTAGVWLIYGINTTSLASGSPCQRTGVRLRLYQSRGDNAVISAVTFDPLFD